MAAQAVDQLVTQVVEIDGGVGNLSQGNDRVLVVIALDSERCSGRNVARALGCEHHELEARGHAEDAVFHGDAGHQASLRRQR
jgi:hypothetical protein